MTDKTIREKIAKDIDRILNHDFRAALSKASVLEGTDQYIAIGNAVREGTAAILAIPEIKEGLELREKAESGKPETAMCPICREVLTCVHCGD